MFKIYLDTSVISALFDDKNPENMPNLEIQG
jgi:predicted nucleic acid-binding protein